jgi:beta-mannosidase
LSARAELRRGSDWLVHVASEQFAQYVALDVPGFRASDSWFHLLPGEAHEIALHGEGSPDGRVRALNAIAPIRIEVPE